MSKFPRLSAVMYCTSFLIALISAGYLFISVEMQLRSTALFTALKQNNPSAHSFCNDVISSKITANNTMTIDDVADNYVYCYNWMNQRDYFIQQLETFNSKAYQTCRSEGDHILDCFVNTCLINRIDQCKQAPIVRDDPFQIRVQH